MRIETWKTEIAMLDGKFEPVWGDQIFIDQDGVILILDDDGENCVVIEKEVAWLQRNTRLELEKEEKEDFDIEAAMREVLGKVIKKSRRKKPIVEDDEELMAKAYIVAIEHMKRKAMKERCSKAAKGALKESQGKVKDDDFDIEGAMRTIMSK